MNSNFSDKQINAYAAAFREGDAIWCDGEWWEVVKNEKNGDNRLTAYADGNIFVINNGQGGGCYSGSHYGFEEEGLNKNPYRVTTLEDYELQGGEKLVWLGSPAKFLTYGQTYKTSIGSSGNVLLSGDGWSILSVYDYEGWGIIPHYDQVARSKFNVGDKVLIASTFTGVIKSTISNTSGGDICEVLVIDKHGEERVNHYWERDLELYIEGPPAPRVESETTSFTADLHHVLSDLESTLKSKNKDCGNSFKQSYDEFGMTAVNIRLTDKFNHFKQLSKGVEPQVDESLKDTIKDIAGYMVLTLIELNRDDNDE